ncbi:urease accessory protein UreF [Megalodesulfovibrio paquesii]
MTLPDRRILALLHLASPALPVGAFAYSQGLASAIDLGWLRDEADIAAWLEGLLVHGLGRLDLPVLLRLHAAVQAGDSAAIARWDAVIQASRETKELLLEEVQLGQALRRLLAGQGLLSEARELARPASSGQLALPATSGQPALSTSPGQLALPASPGWTCMFALAAAALGLKDIEDGPAVALAYAWSWLENQLAAAGKALPLGQTAAQRILIALSDPLYRTVEGAGNVPDDELGAALPGLALASSLHETQHSRLFRS